MEIKLGNSKMEYKLLVGEVGGIFEDNNIEFLVNKHLAEGWTLYGYTQIAAPSIGITRVYQPVVRYIIPYQQV